MKKTLTAVLTLLFAVPLAGAAQSGQTAITPLSQPAKSQTSAGNKRGPVFRATKEQIMQAQILLKSRGLYVGEPTGKLDTDTRTALKKYQVGAQVKETGTLNRPTLEKMNIQLTEKQKSR